MRQGMEYAEIRQRVHAYFAQALGLSKARRDREGPLDDQELQYYASWQITADQAIKAGTDPHEGFVDDLVIDQVCRTSNIPLDILEAKRLTIQREVSTAFRDYCKAMQEQSTALHNYDFVHRLELTSPAPIKQKDCITLSRLTDVFIQEKLLGKAWTPKTKEERRSHFELLHEILGATTEVKTLGVSDVQTVKAVLQRYPRNRNKDPLTRDLSLEDALGVIAVQKISVVTINKHITAYADLFKWAKANGHTVLDLFAGTTIRQHKERSVAERTAFSSEQIGAIRTALADLRPRLAKKPYRYWGTMIGLYTGARLNEVCQLELADIKRDEDIWYFDINDDGERKNLKNTASRRRVPIHRTLIGLGLLDYVTDLRQRGEMRLFPELSYCPKNGWGRSLGRWFNEDFLPSLAIKTQELVFHSFRHTMVTRLSQHDIPISLVQAIVGHQSDTVTLNTYMRSGFTLIQLSDAIARIE